jgi:hypothetical protein
MHFCAIHVDESACAGESDVYVVVPGTARTAWAVPRDALPQFLPVLEQAVGSDHRPRCPACGADLPKLAQFVCARAHCEPSDPG